MVYSYMERDCMKLGFCTDGICRQSDQIKHVRGSGMRLHPYLRRFTAEVIDQCAQKDILRSTIEESLVIAKKDE